MCNPIGGCFSAVKARVKEHLALYSNEMTIQESFSSMTERRKALLVVRSF